MFDLLLPTMDFFIVCLFNFVSERSPATEMKGKQTSLLQRASTDSRARTAAMLVNRLSR